MAMGRNTILLTLPQAVSAICRDFCQYPPQLLLFAGLVRFGSDGRIAVRRETNRQGFWVSESGSSRMIWLEGQRLVTYMCEWVTRYESDPQGLSEICRRVFQTHAESITDPATQSTAICIGTGMDTFHCVQCGEWCRIPHDLALRPPLGPPRCGILGAGRCRRRDAKRGEKKYQWEGNPSCSLVGLVKNPGHRQRGHADPWYKRRTTKACQANHDTRSDGASY